MLILQSVNRVLCTLCKLHTASTEQCSQFIVLIVHNFKKVLFKLARAYLHNFKKVHISTVRGVLHKFMKVHIVHIFQCLAALGTTCREDILHRRQLALRAPSFKISASLDICHYGSQNPSVQLHGTVQYSG